MDISSVSGTSSVWSTSATSATGVQTSTAQLGGHHHHHHGGGDGACMMQSIMQALTQAGINTTGLQPGQNAQAASSSANGTDADGDSDGSTTVAGTSGASSTRADVGALMHDLFSALKSQSASAAGGAAAGYGGMSTAINSLLSEAQSGNSNDPAIAKLQSDLNQLASDSQGSGANGSSPSLTSFLQSLASSIQSGNGTSTGTLVSVQS